MGLKWFYYCSGFKSRLINFLTMNLLIKGSSAKSLTQPRFYMEKRAMSHQVGLYYFETQINCVLERERERERSLPNNLLFLNRETCDSN